MKQGDNLLPTLFSVFINDLVQEINDLNLGVDLLETKLSLLLYADDIALVANSAEELQCMLNTLHQRCKRWRELINTDKSKCIHFRKPRTKETNFEFTVGKNKLEKVENYKYLGVTFGHNENFITNAANLSKSDGRALWKMIFKIHNSQDFGFYAYEKLYYSCVVPILEYASSVWGYRKYQTIDNIQNRTIRYFLGVHRFAPTLALHGDVRWIPSQFRRWTNMVRYKNRLLKFEDDRITKLAFYADYNRCTDNWCSELKDIFYKLNFEPYFESKTAINLKTVEMNL